MDAAIGAIGGLAGGLLGVGGGFVMVPLQVIWAKRTQHRATGTSLAAILPIGVVAAATYYFGGKSPQTDLTVALFLAVGGIAGAFARVAGRTPDLRSGAQHGLRDPSRRGRSEGGLRRARRGGAAPRRQHRAARSRLRDYALITAGGFVVGIVSGLTGVGGGTLVVPLLGLGFGIGQRIAQGTSLLALLPTSAIGALTHHRSGDVNVRAAMWMGAAAFPPASPARPWPAVRALRAVAALQRVLGAATSAASCLAAAATLGCGPPEAAAKSVAAFGRARLRRRLLLTPPRGA